MSPLGGLVGTSEGTHATRDSRLLPQPGFPVVPLRDQLPISSGQTLKRPLLSTPDHQQTPDLPPPVLSGGGIGAPTLSLPDLLPLRLRSPLSSQSHVFEM